MSEPTIHRPADAGQLRELVAWAVAEEQPLEIAGHGTKRIIGRPVEAEHLVSVDGLSGITLYEPDELVMSAGAGTPLAMIEAELAERGQELTFEPADYGALLGGRPRQPDDRRRVRGQRRRAAPAEVGCCARPSARAALRHRPRARRSRPAAGWSRTSPATTCASC